MKINGFYIFAFFTLLLCSIILFFYYEKSQQSAIHQAQLRTEDLLRNVKASKMFFKNKQQSKIREYHTNGLLKNDEFSPELYSCTYATKQINIFYNELRTNANLPIINISFAALDPKNIENRATIKERKLLNEFNKNTISSYKKIIEIKENKYLYYAKPIDRTKKSCLQCHGNPLNAPKIIIEKYGENQGFYSKEGEIRAFIKVIMPLNNYIKDAQKLFILIATSILLLLLLIFILTKSIVRKNKKTSKQLQKVINTLDDLIIVRSNIKIHAVNKSFLKFFGVKDSKSFSQKYSCENSIFIKGENFIDIDLNQNLTKIIEKINSTEKTKRIVQIRNKAEEIHTLSIKIDKLEENEDLYLIVLSDITKLQQRAEKFKKRANIDPLTGTFSRQKFNALYESEFARSIRYFNPLTVLFLDIDHFKEVNDTYGHDIGDLTLKEFSKIISTRTREYDIFARWGGEEFILMLPQTNINDGYKLAEKIRMSILSHKFEKLDNLTCSIGLSMLKKGDSKEEIIKRADSALYKAKNGGRNRTIIEI